MAKKRKKMNKYARRRMTLLAILVIIVLLIIFGITGSKGKKDTKIYYLVGDKIQTLKEELKVESNDVVYMSLDDIKNIYDNNIFYDEIGHSIITTYNKHVCYMNLDSKTVNINGSSNTIKAGPKKINNIVYIPISELELVYDLDLNYAEESNKVIVDSISKQKITVKTLEKVNLKEDTGVFSDKIEKIDKNRTVVLLEDGDDYCKVRTELGNVGYIKKDKVSEKKIIRNNMKESKIENLNIIKEFKTIDDISKDLNIIVGKNNVVKLDAFKISKEKKVELANSVNSDKYKKFIKWTEENGVSIFATIKNSDDISEMMMTYRDRSEIIDNIYNEMILNNYKYLHINFTKINDVNSFYRFIIELEPRLKESGMKVVVSLNDNIQEEKIKDIVDYIIKED